MDNQKNSSSPDSQKCEVGERNNNDVSSPGSIRADKDESANDKDDEENNTVGNLQEQEASGEETGSVFSKQGSHKSNHTPKRTHGARKGDESPPRVSKQRQEKKEQQQHRRSPRPSSTEGPEGSNATTMTKKRLLNSGEEDKDTSNSGINPRKSRSLSPKDRRKHQMEKHCLSNSSTSFEAAKNNNTTATTTAAAVKSMSKAFSKDAEAEKSGLDGGAGAMSRSSFTIRSNPKKARGGRSNFASSFSILSSKASKILESPKPLTATESQSPLARDNANEPQLAPERIRNTSSSSSAWTRHRRPTKACKPTTTTDDENENASSSLTVPSILRRDKKDDMDMDRNNVETSTLEHNKEGIGTPLGLTHETDLPQGRNCAENRASSNITSMITNQGTADVPLLLDVETALNAILDSPTFISVSSSGTKNHDQKHKKGPLQHMKTQSKSTSEPAIPKECDKEAEVLQDWTQVVTAPAFPRKKVREERKSSTRCLRRVTVNFRTGHPGDASSIALLFQRHNQGLPAQKQQSTGRCDEEKKPANAEKCSEIKPEENGHLSVSDSNVPPQIATLHGGHVGEEAQDHDQDHLLTDKILQGMGDESTTPPAFHAILADLSVHTETMEKEIIEEAQNSTIAKDSTPRATSSNDKKINTTKRERCNCAAAALVSVEWDGHQQTRVLRATLLLPATGDDRSHPMPAVMTAITPRVRGVLERRFVLRLSALALMTGCSTLRLVPPPTTSEGSFGDSAKVGLLKSIAGVGGTGNVRTSVGVTQRPVML